MTDLKPTSPRGLDIAQVCARLGGNKPLDPSTLWRHIARSRLPQPFYLWDGAPRFVEAEVDAYIARKIAERDDPTCAAAQRERVQRREQRMGEARARAKAGTVASKSKKHVSRGRRRRSTA